MRWFVVLLLLARVSYAHQSSTKYVGLTIDGTRVSVALRCVPNDVTEPMGLRPDTRPSLASSVAAAKVPAYVASWLALRADDVPCVQSSLAAHAEPDGFLAVTWIATCPAPIATLTLDFAPFFQLDRRMDAFVSVHGTDRALHVTAAQPALAIDVGSRVPILAGAFAPERLAFALLIVIVACSASSTTSAARRAAIGLITYSLAFAIGSFGWLEITPAVTQVLVPTTLVYAGAEVALRPGSCWRLATFGAFGVLHGIASATSPSVSNLIFNIGASLVAGTIALALGVPLVRLAARRRHALRVMRVMRFMRYVAGAVGVYGIAWLVWRVFGT